MVTTGPGAKAKILLEKTKLLVTISADASVRITEEGVELVSGSKSSVKERTLKVLRPDPKLAEQSRHLGGSFAMRIAEMKLKALNLGDTFIRDTRPTFRWKCTKEGGSFLITLFEGGSEGDKIKLWERQSAGDKFTHPEGEPALEQGKSYYWEIFEITEGRSSVVSSQFQVLTGEQSKNFVKELKNLKKTVTADEEDKLTALYLEIDLLNKYYLKDEVKQLEEKLAVEGME